MAFHPDQVVGEYRIVRPLGQGGLGAVYEGLHLISQRSDALKVLLPGQGDTPDMAERFRREIQLLASLDHPNISGLHNAFYFEDQLIMVMELVRGEDLRSLTRRLRLEIPILIGFAEQALRALEYAHAHGVVHRDIKPANIMVSPAGVIKVLDFGIAITERSTELTAAGAVIGSPTHISPEQIRGGKATPQSDIYSFGVTLYELIAGQPPLQGATAYDLLLAHINTVPVPLHELRPDIPVGLSAAVSKALEKDPARRFRSAAEFLTALRSAEPAADTITATAAAIAQPAAVAQRAIVAQHAIVAERAIASDISRPLTASSTLPLDPVIRHLAAFIGPIAKIVVNRLSRTCTDVDQLYAEAAGQIEDEKERERFLRTRPR